MLHDKRSALSSYVSGLLASGRTVFTAEEAERALGVGRGAFLDAAERLQCRKALPSPRQGFHVVVPPQHASWGTPPPAWYIDGLMRREGQPCYVGLLKAADLHGATHQAVMEFQVVSNKRLPKIRAGRNLIVFCFRKEMEAVGGGNRGPQDRHRHDEDLVGRADGARSAALSAGVRRNRPCRHGPLGPRRKHRSRAARRPGPRSTGSRYGTRTSRPSRRSGIRDGASCGAHRIESRTVELIELCRALVRIDCTNPPGDTIAMVEAVEAVLDGTDGIKFAAWWARRRSSTW